MRLTTPQRYRDIIVSIIEQYLPQAKIIIYGSRAREDFHEGADIDIAIDAGAPLSPLIKNNIIEALEESDLPIPFDMVDFYSVDKAMQQNIIREGVVWKN